MTSNLFSDCAGRAAVYVHGRECTIELAIRFLIAQSGALCATGTRKALDRVFAGAGVRLERRQARIGVPLFI